MGQFIDTFDTQARGAVMVIAREDHDPFDQWGWCMSWWFDLVAEIDLRGEPVPEDMQYRPSPFGSEVSEDRANFMHEFSLEGLLYAARVMQRFAHLLKRAGESY